MVNFKDGDFVMCGSLRMNVRLYRGKDENGCVFCEWTDPESGEMKDDWFDPSSLKAIL